MAEDLLAAARSEALEALAADRTSGVRFHRHFMGIRSNPSEDEGCRSLLLAHRQTLGPGGAPHPGALATLADVALAAALRRRLTAPQRVATFGLTLHIVRETPVPRVHSCAEPVSVDEGTGLARCLLTDPNGGLLAEASGSFAVRNPLTNTAWRMVARDIEIGDPAPAPPAAAELTAEERLVVAHVERTVPLDGPDGPYGSFLGIEWQERGTGRVRARWPLGPHLWNRSGHVHGGAVFGTLAAVSLACIPPGTGARLVEQHVQYVRPATGEGIRLEAEMLRRGQRLISVHATILDAQGRTIAGALSTLDGSEGNQRVAGPPV